VDKPTDRGVLLALDAKSGALRWRYDPVRYRGTGVGISATPAVDERRGIVFIGTGNPTPRGHPPPGPDRDSESIVALRLATGKKLWTFGPVHPHDTDDDDFFASPNRFLVRPGAQRWVIGEPNKDGTYYAVDAVSGRLFWRRVLVPMDALAEPIGTAAVAHDRIFIPLFGSRGWLVTLRTRDGSVLWRRQLATGAYEAPAVWGNVAFVTTAGGTLFAFDGATGRALATLNVGGRLEGRGPSVVGNSLYLAAGSVLRAYTIETQPR
jgi:glucose dehydrogenase